MRTAFSIGNFRAFTETQRTPLWPVTMIVGFNACIPPTLTPGGRILGYGGGGD